MQLQTLIAASFFVGFIATARADARADCTNACNIQYGIDTNSCAQIESTAYQAATNKYIGATNIDYNTYITTTNNDYVTETNSTAACSNTMVLQDTIASNNCASAISQAIINENAQIAVCNGDPQCIAKAQTDEATIEVNDTAARGTAVANNAATDGNCIQAAQGLEAANDQIAANNQSNNDNTAYQNLLTDLNNADLAFNLCMYQANQKFATCIGNCPTA